MTRGAAVPGVGRPLQKTQLQSRAVGNGHRPGDVALLGFNRGVRAGHSGHEQLAAKTKQLSCLVCQAEGKERQKATLGAQGVEKVLPVVMGCPPAAGPAAAHLPAPRPSSAPSPLISCPMCTRSISMTAACTAM